MNQEKQFKIGVAGITIEFIADESLVLRLPDSHRSFLVDQDKPDLILRVHYGDIPNLLLQERLFDSSESGGVWSLYRSQGKYEITFISPLFGPLPYRVVVIDSNFTHGELYIRPVTHPGMLDSVPKVSNEELPCMDPTDYPLDEVLFVSLLSRGQGVDFHACGIDLESNGILFSGVSGAGKSTLAELWKKTEVKILSDDRIIIRRVNSQIWMYGTPWHGDARISLPKSVPLRAVYFLEQSKENKILPLGVTESAFRLIVRCFPTYYSKQGMEYTIGFITELAQEIPCFVLEFTPDERAIDSILSHVESLALQSK